MTSSIPRKTAQSADPTLELLVQLALHAPTEASLARGRLEGPIDWLRLSALARQHRLLPMLVRNLSHMDAMPPDDWWERNRQTARRSHARAVCIAAELISVQSALRMAGVPSLAVKGPALGVLAHGTPALRTMADLDLVVPERDRHGSSRLLASRGYRALPVVDPRVRLFSHPERRFHLEIHHRLDKEYLPLFPLENSVWSSPDKVEVMGAAVDVLPIELHARFLIYHGSRHQWSRLGWLSVLVDLLRRQAGRLDGEALAREAERRGIGAMARMTAVLARETWPDVGPLLPIGPARSRRASNFAHRIRSGWAVEEQPLGPRDLETARELFVRLLRRAFYLLGLVDRPGPMARAAVGIARRTLAKTTGSTHPASAKAGYATPLDPKDKTPH